MNGNDMFLDLKQRVKQCHAVSASAHADNDGFVADVVLGKKRFNGFDHDNGWIRDCALSQHSFHSDSGLD